MCSQCANTAHSAIFFTFDCCLLHKGYLCKNLTVSSSWRDLGGSAVLFPGMNRYAITVSCASVQAMVCYIVETGLSYSTSELFLLAHMLEMQQIAFRTLVALEKINKY